MSLQSRISDLITAIGSDIKSLKTSTAIGPWVPLTLNAKLASVSGYRSAAYRLENGGKNIRLRGTCAIVTALVNGDVLFTFPSEAWPDAIVRTFTIPSGVLAIEISPTTGSVAVQGSAVTGAKNLPLDHITFALV